MMNEKKIHNILMIIALCLMTLSFFTIYFQNKTPKIIEKRDTTIVRDTVWRDTTIIEKQLVPKEVIKKKVDTVYTEKGDTLHFVTESKVFEKRILSAKDTADLQIYTTGINTSLDSLKFKLKTYSVYTTETVEITKYRERSRLKVGLGVGYGIGLKNREFEPFAGIIVSYNF